MSRPLAAPSARVEQVRLHLLPPGVQGRAGAPVQSRSAGLLPRRREALDDLAHLERLPAHGRQGLGQGEPRRHRVERLAIHHLQVDATAGLASELGGLRDELDRSRGQPGERALW